MNLATTLAVMAAVTAALSVSGCAPAPGVDSGPSSALLSDGEHALIGQWSPRRAIPGLAAGLKFDASGTCWMFLTAPGPQSDSELLGRCDWSLEQDSLLLVFEEGVGRGAGVSEALLIDGDLHFVPVEDSCEQRSGLLLASEWVWDGGALPSSPS